MRVLARAGWCDTRAPLRQGQRVIVRAEGSWTVDGAQWSGAAGRDERHADAVLDTAGLGALVGSVGGVVFPIGQNADVRSPASGTLELSINDVVRALTDNKGYVVVQISLLD